MQNGAAEIKILAEHKAGEIVRAMRENGERVGPHDGAAKSSIKRTNRASGGGSTFERKGDADA